jgi:CYTH domain-containing protein
MKNNSGPVIAEIELLSEDETFVLAPWIDEEATGDLRYCNADLINKPYLSW